MNEGLKMKKSTICLIIVIMVFMAACGKKEVEFDAQKYVQAVLDAKYQNDYEEYAKQLGVSKDEAKEELFTEFHDSLEAQLKLTGMEMTEEDIERYVQLETLLRTKVQYEVKEAIKDDQGNYKVEVNVIPVDGYSSYQENFQSDLQKAVNEGKTEAEYIDVFLDCVQNSIENAAVLEQKTIILNVICSEEENVKRYSLEEKDMLNFDLTATAQF